MPRPVDLLPADRPDALNSVRDILAQARSGQIEYRKTPDDWRDQVLYFLLPDRFSDGREDTRPLLARSDIRALRQAATRPDMNWKAWADSGKRWQGGTIKGIQSKLGYIADLGVTAVWVGPVFKQRVRLDTYHGYGIQDFLEVDARFGTRRDLIELVQAAHDRGMYIILDVILNHSGDNWGYVKPGDSFDHAFNEPPFLPWPNFYGNPNDADKRDWKLAWRNDQQLGFTDNPADVHAADEGVWPTDLRDASVYTRAGKGDLGAGDLGDEHAEHKRTDFFGLKDFALDVGQNLNALVECYQYWIALTDCDGFRIDTLKHISVEEARNYCGAVREFADQIGKPNFFLVAEIAGGSFAQDFYLDRLAVLKRNLSAALDIGEARPELTAIGKGLENAADYLEGFKENSEGFGSHRSAGNQHVSIVDDHDHVFGAKVRFSADIPDDSPVKDYQIIAPTAIQFFTLGIPCVYYGSEQAFAGPAQSQRQYLLNEGWNDGGNSGDRYLREAIFGPEHPRAKFDNDLNTQVANLDTSLPGFGPFGTAGKHCFDQQSPAYVRIAHLATVRAAHPVLRVGRQYARQVRLPFTGFDFPATGEVIAWSRILSNREALCVVNANGSAARGGDIVVDASLWAPGTQFEVVANTAHAAAGNAFAGTHSIGSKLSVQRPDPNGPAYLEIRDIAPAEVVVLLSPLR